MSYGEQAALEGVVARLRPAISLEIGTFTGASLERIAAHSGQVHTFDLASHVSERLPNVDYHLGDSQVTVPRVLAEIERAGETVDFVLVDGDHARAGVRKDVENLLASPALQHTVILLHDAANEDVRAGIRDADMTRPELAYVNLSFVPSWSPRSIIAETWGGLGVIVVDRAGEFWKSRRRVDANVFWATSVRQPLSWRLAAPLRRLKRAVLYRLRPLLRRLRGTRGVRLD
jgi:hypothetical protein